MMFGHGVAISFEKQTQHCNSWGISFILWMSLMLDIKHWSQPSFVSHWVSGMPSFMAEVGHWFLEHPKCSALLGAEIPLCMNLSLKAAFTCAEVHGVLKMMFLQGDRGCLHLKEWLHVPVQEPFSPWGCSRAVGSRMHPA